MNADDTAAVGEKLGRAAMPGDVICLTGDLGTGKTTLTQGIASGLGIPSGDVTSPTFNLLSEHRGGRIPLYHFDVYRLSGPDDLYHLGFDDYIAQPDGLIVIEWADIVIDGVPDDHLQIEIRHSSTPSERVFDLSATGSASARLLEALR